MSDKRDLRYIIYGAGAIGNTVGGHLGLAGKEVILIARPAHVNAINESGLRMITPSGTHTVKVAAVTAPDRIDFTPRDVVILSVKGQDTEEALQALRALTGDVPVFCFQNGVRNEEIASRYFPRVYGTMVSVGGVFINPGEVTVRRDPPGHLIMGRYPQGTDALLEDVAAGLREAGFYVLVTPEVMPYKWGKLMQNLANAPIAITDSRTVLNADGKYELADEETKRVIRAAGQEAREILAEAGVPWKPQRDWVKEWPDYNAAPRSVLSTEEQSSTWQSLARRRGSVETDFFHGEIVRLAKRLGKQAPVNEGLVRISEEMAHNHEPPGKYTPRQLLELLGLS
ncbi:MAG: ketopantoate reductase family protein [Chloroflexota bacterium]